MDNKITKSLLADKSAFIFILLAIVISGILITAWLVVREDHRIRQSLLDESEVIAQAINVSHIKQIRGDSSDMQNPYYLILKKQLSTIAQVNKRYHFVYLLGRKPSGEVFFFVDNAKPGSVEESVAGSVYSEASDHLLDVFESGESGTEGPLSDRWGTFISSMVPVYQRDCVRPVAVLGIDIDAGLRKQLLIKAALPSVIFFLLIIFLVFVASALIRERERKGVSAPLPMQYIESLFVVVAGILTTVFLSYLFFMKSQKDKHDAFVRLAASRSFAVASEINEIQNSRLEGLAAFFSGSDLVRKDEFEKFTSFLMRSSEVIAWNWVSAVKQDELKSFLAHLPEKGIEQFSVWEYDSTGARIPAKPKKIYLPVTLITQGFENETVLGFDQSSDSVRAAACRAALASPELIACAGPVTLRQDTNFHNGLIVFRAVYADQEKPVLKGYAVAVLHANQLVNQEMSEMTKTDIRISFINSDGTTRLLKDYQHQDSEESAENVFRRYVFAFGKVFEICIIAQDSNNILSGYRNVWISLISGFSITFSLAFVFWFFVRSRFKLERLVVERTTMFQESDSRFRQVAEQLSELIVIVNRKGQVVFASPASQPVVGLEPDELIGRYYIEFLDPSEIKESLKAFFDLYSSKKRVLNMELKMKKADGSSFYGEVAGTPFRLNNEDTVLLTIRDISTRKQSQQELIFAKEKAEESDRLKTRFLVNIGHEIRTPMNGIMGFLDLLKDMDMSREERQMFITAVNMSGHRLLNTIDDIIELSKIESGELTVVKGSVVLSDLLQDVGKKFKKTIEEKNLAFEILSPNPDVPGMIVSDKDKLQTVLEKIVANAIKFSNTGKIQLGTTCASGILTIFVKDNGIGIEKDRLEAIFDRFVQAETTLTRHYEGAGLGLSIARAFVEVMGGSIRVESAPGAGSTFFVNIPVA